MPHRLAAITHLHNPERQHLLEELVAEGSGKQLPSHLRAFQEHAVSCGPSDIHVIMSTSPASRPRYMLGCDRSTSYYIQSSRAMAGFTPILLRHLRSPTDPVHVSQPLLSGKSLRSSSVDDVWVAAQ